MKKFSLIVMALALVMGLSQCQKRPNAPVLGGVMPATKTITFTTHGDGGAKGSFDQNDGLLDYAWDKDNDVLHVYLQKGGDKFTAGEYLGEMRIVSTPDKYSAVFQGTFTSLYPETGWIRFVHCGTAVNVEGGASDVVDFSNQDGSIATVSSKVIAICDQKITDGCTYNFEDCSLAVQFGVVKFSFEKFLSDNDVTLSGVAETGLKLKNDGTIAYKAGTASTLGNMSANKTAYYTVLMPKDETTYKFTCGGQSASKKAKIDAGVFYTRKYEAGEPVVLDVLPEGALPGEFSVSETEKIHFSKGNLYWDNSENKWRFEDNQCDFRTIEKKAAVIGCEYFEKGTPDGDWGLVNYSTHKTDFGRLYTYTDDETYAFDGDFIDWAVNMENGWFTMSKDLWVYMLYTRENAESLWKFTTFPVKKGEGTKDLKGLILLPDGTSPTAFDEINDIDDLDKFNAVFFPITGDRHGKNLANVDEQVYYWTSTYKDCPHDGCWRVSLNWSKDVPCIEIIQQDRKYGRTVRLVRMMNDEDEIDSFTQEPW